MVFSIEILKNTQGGKFQDNSPLNSSSLLFMKRIEQQQQYHNKRKTKFWSALVVRVL